MFRAVVRVTLRPSILDPQGKAIRQTLHKLGYDNVRNVRAGKMLELLIDAEDPTEAEQIARDAASNLLANPVMEDFTIEIEPAPAVSHG